MGNIPPIKPTAGLSIHLSTPAYLMDHHFQGRPVLPAVEAMEALARIAKETHPDLSIHSITDIRFDKFLYLDPHQHGLDAVADLQPAQDIGSLQACLTTRSRAPKSAITRSKVHARLSFSQSNAGPEAWPMDVAAALEGVCIQVPPEKLYEELVPFGPAFRNIVAPVWISPDGALACIRTPDYPRQTCLGSPFALDAVMHAACAWGQHYQGFVPFPVAMERRSIVRPTLPGQVYYGRVRPRRVLDDLLVVDIELRDIQGNLCESVLGVQMRDVSGGRLRPPQWIARTAAPDPLAEIREQCLGLTVVELDGVAPFADRAFTPLEKERFVTMGPRRRKSFLAARLAVKRLFRRCRGQGYSLPAQVIETVCKDTPLPRCGVPDASAGPDLQCSVSHDRRFAVAAAHSGNIGVDVEEITYKALKNKNIYMNEKEVRLVRQSLLEDHKAALQVWSIKEASAKAFGMNLADAWLTARVIDLGDRHSCFTIGGRKMTAHHAMVDNHLVTLVAED
jgi:phosphopantetheinyl transferase (holo-ACP synthase)